MTNGDRQRLQAGAVAALALISILGIVGGIVIAYLGEPVGAIIAVVTGAVGGIVAIVLHDSREGS